MHDCTDVEGRIHEQKPNGTEWEKMALQSNLWSPGSAVSQVFRRHQVIADLF